MSRCNFCLAAFRCLSGPSGFGVQKLRLPFALETGVSNQKIPVSLRLETPFSRAMGNGSFWTPKPSFPGFGDFDPCRGSTGSQSFKVILGILLLGGNGVGRNRGSVTAGCPSARDRQTPYRQRDATPLVLLKEDQSCATFA